jgi:autotransporter-associated beta strand protein
MSPNPFSFRRNTRCWFGVGSDFLMKLRALLFTCILIATARGADYFVDPAGNDSNNGTSTATPWRSLGKVNGTVFQSGDNVFFKRGGTWVGTLSPQGSGNSTARITLGAYGAGPKPLINGNGAWAVIALSSQEYWTIQDFEVTNPAGDTSNSRSGIRVDWSGSGTMRGIQILNNDVHDIRGIKNVNDGGRNNGGIFFWINEPGKADGVLIQGNVVKNIYGQGINFNGEAEYMGGGMNYANCSPNVVARGNTVLTTSGDGLLMLGTHNELVEFNEVGYVGDLSDNGNNIAAAWPTRHVNGLWQYNHVHHTKWLNANDSTAFDNDGFLSGATVFQYNYSHDNAGGFLMEYTWGGDEPGAQTIVRYNISWNENRVLASNRNSARIYNNVFYNPGGTLDVTWTPSQSFILFSNNLFVAAGRTAEFSRQLFMNNNFSGGVTRPVTIDGNRTQDPLFVSPNTTGNLAGFILQSGSPVRNAGFVIVGNGGKDFWGTTLPGTAPHRGASQINVIGDYVATPSFLRLTGADTVEIPVSGTNTSTFTPIVRDQNFRPISGAPVTWSVSPATAGVSINASGVLSVASTVTPRRLAVQATSGSTSVSYTVVLFANHPLAYTWGGGDGAWTDTSATGWDGGPPVSGDSATINSGAVAATTNNQQGGIAVTVSGSGIFRSGGFYLTPGNLTLASGGTVTLENTSHYANYGGGWLPATVTVNGTSATGSTLLGGNTHAYWNMSNGTVFDVADVTGNANTDLDVSAALKDAVGSPDTSWTSSGIVKNGAGTMTLTKTNAYTGPTTVNAGTLAVNGSLASGSVSIASGSTLAGGGSIGGATTISGTHSPGGSSTGILTHTGALTYGATARLAWQLNSHVTSGGSGTAYDRVTAAGITVNAGAAIDITLNAPGSAVNFTDTFWSTARSWTLINHTSRTGTFTLGTVTADSGGRPAANYGTFALSHTAGTVTLNWTPGTPLQNWRYQHFGTTANTGPAADTFDANNDGETNLLEFATAQNPLTPALAAIGLVKNGATLEFTYTRATAALADGVIFTVEWRDSLTTGAWSSAGVTEQILSDNGTVQTVKASVAAGSGSRFLHLKVSEQ